MYPLQKITFDCGNAIRNMADNTVNSEDSLIFQIEGFVSNDAFPRTVSYDSIELQVQ